ncbi:MAG: alanyl-tRNA editing protein [Burkholderiales bacterium]|nr:alanyl-tRNA editing protein [Burkholderiales bacterium]
MTRLLYRDDAYLQRCETQVASVDARGIRLEATVFYAAAGGQPGDSGVLRLADGATVAIVDAIPGEAPDEVIHVPAPGVGAPAVGTPVVAEIDWPRRYRHMRLHTCMHLLCAAVPYPVTGGQIAADRARLDFDTQGEALDKDRLSARLNELVAGAHPVAPRWISEAELAANPQLVRTMSVKPPAGQGRVRLLEIDGVDLQPCGGTHVRNTSEIGRVAVLKIESKGRRNRRVVVGFVE